MSLDAFEVPLPALRNANPNKRLVVGIAVYANSISTTGNTRKLLILQRSASEDAFPSMYEIPGGHADSEDCTILDTVRRELKEETGLVASEVKTAFEGFEYRTSKGDTIQFNFVVTIEGTAESVIVKLNPKEHENYAWIEESDDLNSFPITDQMRTVIANAFNATHSMIFE